MVTVLFLDFVIEFAKFSKIDLGKTQMLPIFVPFSTGRYHVPNERNEVSANGLCIDFLLFYPVMHKVDNVGIFVSF